MNKNIKIHKQVKKTSSSNNKLSKYILGTCLISACSLIPMPSHALSAVADTGASFPGLGYGAQILDIILKNWNNPDQTATGTTTITLRIAKDGRPFSCETRAFSSSKLTDASFCDTVANIGTFPPYAGTQNPEITLTFRHNGVAKSANQALLNSQANIDTTLHSQPAPTTPTIRTQPDPYHQAGQTYNMQNATQAQQIPTLTPETAPSPTQAELQQNHHLAQQPLLPTDQVSILSSNPPINPQTNAPVHTQNLPQSTTATQTNDTILPESTINPLEANEHNISHEPQRAITREEALAPPSENLVLPEKAMEEYSKQIFMQARTQIRPPNNIEKGTYSTIARIDITGSGTLQNVVVQKSSGNKELDESVISVLKNNVNYPPTPNRDQQSIWLTFTIKK